MLEEGQYVREYALTPQGDPICLSEYACLILNNNENTHLVLIEDYSSAMGPALKLSHINESATFDELKLDRREGRNRLIYIYNM